jgi:hypothetical protein
MMLILVQPKELNNVLADIELLQNDFEEKIKTQTIEVERIRERHQAELQLLEKLKFEFDQFNRLVLPKFSIVSYTPKTTEFYRASFRNYDPILQKSIARVVHLGPANDYKGKDDPELIYLAKIQIIKYLKSKSPGIYADLISNK